MVQACGIEQIISERVTRKEDRWLYRPTNWFVLMAVLNIVWLPWEQRNVLSALWHTCGLGEQTVGSTIDRIMAGCAWIEVPLGLCHSPYWTAKQSQATLLVIIHHEGKLPSRISTVCTCHAMWTTLEIRL